MNKIHPHSFDSMVAESDPSLPEFAIGFGLANWRLQEDGQ